MQPASPGHLDPFGQPERLGKPFTFSLVFHAALIGSLLVSAFFQSSSKPFMGDEHPGAGVQVTAVKTIPIPSKQGQINHLANDTESVVPQEKPLKLRDQRPVTPPVPKKAIELPDRTPPKTIPKPASPVQYRPNQIYARNQVFTKTPEALKSPQIGLQGGGGVGIGPNSPFGYQFGAYAGQIHDLIASKWNQAGVSASPTQQAIVSIRIMRDGTVTVASLQPSGSYTLDTSARRAVLDASPLPPLPPGFPRTEADVDLLFQLRR
jgi:protein TonB